MIPAKRASSPSEAIEARQSTGKPSAVAHAADAGPDDRPAKQARVDDPQLLSEQSSVESSAFQSLTEPQHDNEPNQAGIWKRAPGKANARTRANGHALTQRTAMPLIWASSLDNVLGEHIGVESLLAVETMLVDRYVLRPSHVRQLLALSLNPSNCGYKPRAKVRQQRQSGEDDASAAADRDERDPTFESARKVRLATLRTLETVAEVNGPDVIFGVFRGRRTVPGSDGRRGPINGWDELLEDPEDDEDDDAVLYKASKKLGQRCPDVWALLTGAAELSPMPQVGDDPVVEGGWDLLDTFCEIWKREQEQRALNGEPWTSPNFLSCLPTSETGHRTVPSKALEISFWPFQSSESGEHLTGENSTDEAGPGNGLGKQARQMATAVKLYGLIADSVLNNCLDAGSTLDELSMRLKRCRASSVHDFTDHVPEAHAAFTLRLLAHYLKKYSHADGTIALGGLIQPESVSSAENTEPSPVWTNRGRVDGVAYYSSVQRDSFALPSPVELLALFARVPIEVPLDKSNKIEDSQDGLNSETGQEQSSKGAPTKGGRRVPKQKRQLRAASQTLSWDAVDDACRVHRAIKQCLGPQYVAAHEQVARNPVGFYELAGRNESGVDWFARATGEVQAVVEEARAKRPE